MSKTYGIPYIGNKSRLLKKGLLDQLPAGKRLVDLFGGGGAVTHYSILNQGNKYSGFLYNDINPLIVNLFSDVVNGRFWDKYSPLKWISREEFEDKKDTNGYIKYIWSFGNRGESYLYGKELEEYKKNAHNFIIFNDEEALKYLEDYYKDTLYQFIKGIYDDSLHYNQVRLRYTDIVLKLSAIKCCVEYGDNKIYDKYNDYTFNQFYDLKQADLVRDINYYCPNIPKKNKGQKLKEINGVNVEHLERLKQIDGIRLLQQLQHLERLDQIDGIKQLQQLQHLQGLNQIKRIKSIGFNQAQQTLLDFKQPELTITNKSYKDYIYKEGDVVYCDIPYQNTSHDYGGFNQEEFYDWCNDNPFNVYFSSYYLSEFKDNLIWSTKHNTVLGIGNINQERIECLYKI